MNRFTFMRPTLLAATIVVLLLGCSRGPQGPERFVISGNVTHAGKPVPAGKITFEPDRSRGNAGPATTLDIRDGQYDSRGWKGIIAGPMIVRIIGYDGVQPEGEAGQMLPDGRQLFDDYSEEVDLPRETTTHDFEIPAQRKKSAR